MKTFAITLKDLKRLLKSPRFYFSLFLASMAVVGIKVLFSLPFLPIPPMFWAQFIFTFSLPCLGLAILTSCSDIISSESSEGTLLTLFYQPISDFSIVFGKFLAMLTASVIFTALNTVLIKFLHSYIWESTAFVSESQILFCFFLVALLFQLSIIGLTMFFSSIFRRSSTVTIMVIVFYEALAIIYASQLFLGTQQGVSGDFSGSTVLSQIRQILVLLLGSLLGYDIVSIIASLGPTISISEPEIIKYLPVNVDAQRILYFLISPNSKILLTEVLVSLIYILALTVLTLSLSILSIKKKRKEYLD
ncbi:MAG: ABC transporter permease subunit [Candidatus Jordarchaeaceae archaeon]